MFRPPVDVIFWKIRENWQDYVHHQATWFVAINRSFRFSKPKPQACLYWTVEMESVQSDTVFFGWEASMERLNQKDCNLCCWIFGGFVVPIQTPSHLGEFVTKMSRPVEIVKGQQAWVFFACYKHQFLIFFRCWIRRLLNFWLQWIIHCGTWNSLQRGRIFRLLFVLLYRPWVESAPLDTNIRLYSPLGKKNNPSFGISRCFGSKFLWKFFLATLMRFGTDQPWSTKVSGLVHLGMNDDINPVWVVYIKHFFWYEYTWFGHFATWIHLTQILPLTVHTPRCLSWA